MLEVRTIVADVVTIIDPCPRDLIPTTTEQPMDRRSWASDGAPIMIYPFLRFRTIPHLL